MITRRTLLLSGLAAPASAQGSYEDWPFLADDRTDFFTPTLTRRIFVSDGTPRIDTPNQTLRPIAVMSGANGIFVDYNPRQQPIRVSPSSMPPLYFEHRLAAINAPGRLIHEDHGQLDDPLTGAGTGLLVGAEWVTNMHGDTRRLNLNLVLMPDDTLYLVELYRSYEDDEGLTEIFMAYRLEPASL